MTTARARFSLRTSLAIALLACLAVVPGQPAGGTDGESSEPGESPLAFEGERLFSSLVVKLRASDGVAGDELASTVDLDGDIAILGSQFHGGNGAAYVFERTGPGTWAETKLTDTAGNIDDQFANAVAVDGGVAAAGAPNDEATGGIGGSARIFTRNGLGSWSRGPKVFAPIPTLGGDFGDAVAIDGDTLVVGSPLAADAITAGGAAYIFERHLGGTDNWGHRATLVASDPLPGALFGIAVAISGDTVIVGAPGGSTGAILDTGAVYLFERDQFGPNNWGQVAKRNAVDFDIDDEYGNAVAIDADTAVVGARGETGSRGAAYVLERNAGGVNAWGQARKVAGSTSSGGDRFANSVAIDGDILVAGAPSVDLGFAEAGATFVFERNRTGPGLWGEAELVLAPDQAPADQFGVAVAFSRNRLLAGAWLDDDQGDLSGSAYIFSSETDLSISKSDGTASATPGGTLTYIIVATNDGPDDVLDARVTDLFPPVLSCGWTCFAVGGASCTAGPVSGNLIDLADLPAGGSAVYTATCAVAGSAVGTVSNTATIVPPPGITETDLADNSATDVDTVVPTADLSITKTDNSPTAVPGGLVTYTVTVGNAGPSAVVDATVEDDLLAPLESCQWTCAPAGAGAFCQASGGGPIADSTVDLPAGTGVVYTITCRIDAGTSGTLTNTATVTAPGAVTDPVAANDSATDTSTLLLPADLSITKTDGVTLASPGDSLTYTIVVSNATGPNAVTGAVVRDDFPPTHLAGCLWGCVGAGGAICSPGQVAGNLLDLADLPVGSTATYTAVCVVAPGAMGLVANTATVAMPFGFGDPAPVNNSASDLDTLIAVQADLGISKTDGLTSATPGESLAYTITVTNAGPHTASGVGVEDRFSDSPELSCVWGCVPSAGAVCTLGQVSGDLVDVVSIPAAGSLVYTADCAIDPAASGTLSNVATLTVPATINDPNPSNHIATDLDTVLVPSADLAITKDDGQTRATPGGSVLYEIEASNLAGPSDVIAATVTDLFPSELACSWSCDPSGGATCTAIGTGDLVDTVDLPVGGSVLYSVPCFIGAQASGTLDNTATVTGPANLVDPVPGNESATDSDTLDLGADLSLTHTSDPAETVVVGGDLDYTLTVANLGPLTAEDVLLEVVLPAGITLEESQTSLAAGRQGAGDDLGSLLIFFDGFESGDLSQWSDSVGGPGGGGSPPLGCTVSGSTVACNFGDLAGGAVATLMLSTVVDPGTSGQITSRADVSTPTFDQDLANNQANVTVTVEAGPVDVALAISDSPDPVTAGGTLTYTLEVTNGGPAAATGISLSDPLPVEVTIQSASASQGSCSAGATVTCDLEALGVGGTATVTVVVQVDAAVVGSLTNAASVLAAETDLDLTNNTDTETTAVQASSRQPAAPPPDRAQRTGEPPR